MGPREAQVPAETCTPIRNLGLVMYVCITLSKVVCCAGGNGGQYTCDVLTGPGPTLAPSLGKSLMVKKF